MSDDLAKLIKNAKLDGGNPKSGPLVRPGTYQIRLTVEGKSETAMLEVRPDPRVTLPPEALRKQDEEQR